MRLEFHQLDRRWEHLRVRRPDRERRLLASLAALGQQRPIVVVALADQPDRYLVIDGFKRMAALEQLGRDTVEAVVWPMGEAEALLLDRALRSAERDTALEEGWLLAELEQRFGYGLEELARQFDRSVSWVSRRLALVELLPEAVQQQVRNGQITAHLAMKFLVPVARVNLEDCQRMAEAFARHKFHTRQAGRLYTAWRNATLAMRQRILQQPELFLKAQRQVEPPPPATPAEELLRDLDMVQAIAERAGRRLARAAEGMDRDGHEELRRKIERARDQLGRLAERIPREEEHVEPSPTDDYFGVEHSGDQQTRNSAAAGCLPLFGAQSPARQRRAGSRVAPPRESRTLPLPDPGAFTHLQGESRASP